MFPVLREAEEELAVRWRGHSPPGGACAGLCCVCAGFGAGGHPGQCPGQCPVAVPALPSHPSQCPASRSPPPQARFFCPQVTKLPVIPLCQFFPNPAVVLGNIDLPAASSAPLHSVPFPHTSVCYLWSSGMFTFIPLGLFPTKARIYKEL